MARSPLGVSGRTLPDDGTLVHNRKLVGARGFEPPTTGTPYRCATGLRHAPSFSFCHVIIRQATATETIDTLPMRAGKRSPAGPRFRRANYLTSTLAPASSSLALAASASSLVTPSLIAFGRRINDVLGFLETEAGELAHRLDDLDLVGADLGEDGVEFGLLFFLSGGGTTGRRASRQRRRQPEPRRKRPSALRGS